MRALTTTLLSVRPLNMTIVFKDGPPTGQQAARRKKRQTQNEFLGFSHHAPNITSCRPTRRLTNHLLRLGTNMEAPHTLSQPMRSQCDELPVALFFLVGAPLAAKQCVQMHAWTIKRVHPHNVAYTATQTPSFHPKSFSMSLPNFYLEHSLLPENKCLLYAKVMHRPLRCLEVK